VKFHYFDMLVAAFATTKCRLRILGQGGREITLVTSEVTGLVERVTLHNGANGFAVRPTPW
jgi:hypothetical protein